MSLVRTGGQGQRPPGTIRLAAMGCGYPPGLDCLERLASAPPLVYELLFEAMGVVCMPWPPGEDVVEVDVECREEGGDKAQEQGVGDLARGLQVQLVYGYARRCTVKARTREGRRYALVVVEAPGNIRYCYPLGEAAGSVSPGAGGETR